MSRAFVKGSDSDLPEQDLPERKLSASPNYVTPTGLNQLRDRYARLQARHMELKAEGADFDKLELREIERDLRYFSARLDSAILVDIASEPKDEVHFGAWVTTEDETGRRAQFHIVGEDEADAATGKISWLSPLAKALIGARVGEMVKWVRPAGVMELEIAAIAYDE